MQEHLTNACDIGVAQVVYDVWPTSGIVLLAFRTFGPFRGSRRERTPWGCACLGSCGAVVVVELQAVEQALVGLSYVQGGILEGVICDGLD